jgi:copper resistance protein C
MSTARRALAVLVGALAATVLTLGAGMSAAWAHDELVATSPASDAAVPSAPVEVTLEFSRAVQALGTQVHVTGPDGAVVSEGAAEVRDTTVSQPLAADAPAGLHRVTWRATSSDGHVLTGNFAFTVAASVSPAPAVEATDSPDDAPVVETAAQQPPAASPPYGAIATGAALLAGAAGLVLFRRRT